MKVPMKKETPLEERELTKKKGKRADVSFVAGEGQPKAKGKPTDEADFGGQDWPAAPSYMRDEPSKVSKAIAAKRRKR